MEMLGRQKKNIILVDSGDLFFPPGSMAEPLGGKEKEMIDLKIDLYLKTYNLMGYDAFIPGEVDLSLGIDELKRISKQAKFSFLLANLLERQAQKPVFKPYIIKEMGGVKIGLLGLTSRDFFLKNPASEKEKYYLAEPIATARKIISDLKKKNCKIIMAIAHMPENELKAFAQALPEIHFVISGHERRLASRPLEVNNLKIFMAGTRGENLGRLDFFPKEEAGKRLFAHYQILPLTEKYGDHSKTTEMVNQYKARVQTLFPAAAKTALERDHDSRPPQPLVYALPSFVGDQACISCHPEQHQAWQKTPHALAYQTLIKNNKSTDMTCLPCHTTGFGEVSGFADVLENVQCESCHGAKRGHPDNGQKFPPVGEKQCLICHNPAKSPTFDYVSYLAKVRCPTPR
jgi:hypothetical protein